MKKKRRQKDRRKYSERKCSSWKTSVGCLCPRCGAEHNKRLYWTGRGKPRKYCPECEKSGYELSAEIIYSLNIPRSSREKADVL